MQRLVQLPVASIELAGGTVARGLAVGGVEDPHHCVVRVRRRGRGSLAPRPCSASVFRRRWRSSFARKRRLRSLLGWSCSAGGFSLRSRSWRGTSGTGRRRLLATPGQKKKKRGQRRWQNNSQARGYVHGRLHSKHWTGKPGGENQ